MREVRSASVERARFACLLAVLLLLLLAQSALAQSTGSILGTVRDSSGAVVPEAKVTVVNTGTSDTRAAKTGSDGSFRFPALETGHYSLKAEKEGFRVQIETGLNLEVTQELVVNPVLAVGSTSEEVTVSAEAPLINTTNAQLGGMVNEARIAELPLNGRNFTDLTYMQPGVSIDPHHNSSSQTGGLHGSAFTSDGLLVRQNIYVMDGATMIAARGLGPVSESGSSIGVAGIKEFKVVTGAFDASYGFSPGAQVVVVSKNGTNHLHGEVFEYLRNSALDAANYFDKPVIANGFQRLPPFRRNNFGAAIGGPIRRNKTFFHAAYEGLRQFLGQTVVDLVPGVGCHGPNGDNTGVVTAAACPQLGAGAASVTIAPVMKGLLTLYPVPNLANNNFTFPTGAPTQVDWGQGRIDHNFSESDTIFGRYTTDKSYSETQVLGNTATQNIAFPAFAANYVSYDQFVTISENHVFSPSLLNQFRFSYSRTYYFEGNIYPKNQWSPNGVDSVTGPLFSFRPGLPIGRITFTGFPTNGINSSNPQSVKVNHYVPNDDVFYTRGKHAWRFGVQVNRENLGQLQSSPQGQITFNSLSNFLKGIAANYSGRFGPNGGDAIPYRNWYWWIPQFYAQDDWRVSSRLTLNLGLRYSFVAGMHETGGKNWNLRNRATDTAFTNGDSAFAPFSKNHFAPRVGFAWDVFGDGKTALRGGAGIYHDFQLTGLTLSGIISTPPLVQTITHSGGTTPITLPFTFTPADFTTGLSSGAANFFYKNPTIYKWNLAVERQLPWGTGLQVGYVGTRGLHMTRSDEGNPIAPVAIVNGIPYWNGTGTRLNPNFAAGGMQNTAGRSLYNALQASVNKRMSHGIQLQLSYTHTKSWDDSDGLGNDCVGAAGMSQPVAFGPGALRFNRGPSCTDLAHNLRLNWTYHIPNLQSDNFAAKMLHGWWLGNVWSANSGYPFTPMLTSNRSKSGNFTSGVDRVNVATAADAAFCQANPGSCKFQPVPFDASKVITHNPAQWFNPNMFVLSPITTGAGNGVVCTAATCATTGSAFGTLGTAGRGMLRGPGLWTVDLALNKDTHLKWLGESGSLQFRAEIFNILNHPNFNEPNANVFTGAAANFSPYAEAPQSSAGAITSTSTTSRQLQFALKVVF